MLKKLVLRNYRVFRDFAIEFNPGPNILVGDNDAGKSTILEAISLALTGRIRGRSFETELSPYFFNLEATAEYFAEAKSNPKLAPPELIIDLYLEPSDEVALLRGSNNLTTEDEVGVRVRAFLNPEYQDEFQSYLSKTPNLELIPTEYFMTEWKGFSGSGITQRSVPGAASLIDASSIRLATGADYYLQQIIKNNLSAAERVDLTRAYRTLREDFAKLEPVRAINKELTAARGDVSSRALALAIDLSTRQTWEDTLTPHLDQVPLQHVGNGERSILKILLAISRRVETSDTILIEEPENHLSFSSMNILISKIEAKCADRQIIIATHSSFVLNKLGIDSLVLVGRTGVTRLPQMPAETQSYFKKLSGYDTLRVVLADTTVLVEGPSDELVFQRAYLDKNGNLPIADGVDVLEVGGLSFKRFLDIAKPLGKRILVVTDNDGLSPEEKRQTYSDYTDTGTVTVHVGAGEARTLEPQIARANSVETMNKVLATSHDTQAQVEDFMLRDKTRAALRIFESQTSITMPDYVREAIDVLQ